jgi:mannose-6-phosphate isomerase
VDWEIVMTVEQARAHLVAKPWGRTDLRPWNGHHDSGAPMGEVWFERSDTQAPPSALLLKLIFTSAPLSIQVHPDDVFARSIGLVHGKCEAWYVLSASTGAQIAVGLKHRLAPAQLRASIGDGSIAARVRWRPAHEGDATLVSPGTIHAIGAGLVIAEIQQRSDTTFRLFDYGRGRTIHVDAAVGAAKAERAGRQPALRKLTAARTLLVASPHFVLERLTVPAESVWQLNTSAETWLFILSGRGRVGAIDLGTGTAAFIDGDVTRITVGSQGLVGLIAYARASCAPQLLRRLRGPPAREMIQARKRPHVRAKAMSVHCTRPCGRVH